MTTVVYHAPTHPYSPIDALNRNAAALGSPGYGRATAHADYNGHRVSVTYNDYRRYYIAQYTWAGRHVLARGSFATCLAAALREHARGALGSSVAVFPETDEDATLCENTPELLAGSLCDEDRSWYTWRHQCAAASARDSANPGMSRMIFDWPLMQDAISKDDYILALREKYNERAYR